MTFSVFLAEPCRLERFSFSENDLKVICVKNINVEIISNAFQCLQFFLDDTICAKVTLENQRFCLERGVLECLKKKTVWKFDTIQVEHFFSALQETAYKTSKTLRSFLKPRLLEKKGTCYQILEKQYGEFYGDHKLKFMEIAASSLQILDIYWLV